MKKIIVIITVAIGLAAVGVQAQALQPQVPDLLTNVPFISKVATWATSYNTNLVWTNGVTLDTGIATTTGQNISDRLALNYDFAKYFGAGIHGTFIGVGSAFNTAGLNGEFYFLKKYDLKLGAELDLDYDIADSANSGKTVFEIAPGLVASKAMTAQTYLTASWLFPVKTSGKNSGSGTIYIGSGFTF